MKNKFLLIFMLNVFCIFVFGIANIYAETYGDLTYTVTNGEVSITGYNTNITEIEIPKIIDGYPVTSIGDDAFNGCSTLTKVTISDNIKTIGDRAFFRCTSLEDIIIPESVVRMGDIAFYGCENLKNVYISSIKDWCNIDFYIMSSNPLMYADNLYLNGNVVTDLEIPSGVTSIRSFVFNGFDSLISVTIPDGVLCIGDAAFNCCSNLISVIFPDGLTTIGNSVFYGCNNLENITLPDSIATIGTTAFSQCSNLKSVTIPEGVTEIKRYSFQNCSGLMSITIPCTLASIGYKAFDGCANLSEIYYYGTKEVWSNLKISAENTALSTAQIIYIPRTKTNISNDGNIFTVTPVNIGEGNTIILALYNDDVLAQVQKAVYKGEEIPFTATKSYKTAKVMVWDTLNGMIPLCETEFVE